MQEYPLSAISADPASFAQNVEAAEKLQFVEPAQEEEVAEEQAQELRRTVHLSTSLKRMAQWNFQVTHQQGTELDVI